MKTVNKLKTITSGVLVFVAPPCVFISDYLRGRDIISWGTGLLVSMAAMFILPFFIAAVIAGLLANTWPRKMITFAAAVLIQFTLVFGFVPPGARSEMIGIGHRFRNQFQTAEVQSCAESILQKYQNGMLGTNSLPANVFLYPPFTEESIVVANFELPVDLRGKFKCVGINTEYDRVRVIFEVEPQQGIIFGECSDPKGFFHFELGKDLYAYRYQRP